MFRVIKKFIKRIMNSHEKSTEPSSTEPCVHAHNEVKPIDNCMDHCIDDYEYKPDGEVIALWNRAAKDDIGPLIGAIRQLCFFSDFKKCTIRTYAFNKDDVVCIIGKTKRRPTLEIDVSDIDLFDHPMIFRMFRRMQSIIGMHRTSHFMVRVEHAFDNSQIHSEHFVVSRVMNIQTKSDMVVGSGIDSVHHIVLPLHVQLKNISKIPSDIRTIFHHISFSIQPMVFHSQTLDTWVKNELRPTNAQFMQLCIQLAEALCYLHDLNIVHGDIKPGNTLVKKNKIMSAYDKSFPSLSLYLIDFGMSGHPNSSDGTGGTIPFCAPETGNGVNLTKNGDVDIYNWTKVQKCHDVWSMGLMFMTIIVFGKSYVFPKNYPTDFFEPDGHINPEYFNKIQNESMRNLFQQALSPANERITAHEFLALARSIQCDVVGIDDPLSPACECAADDGSVSGRSISVGSSGSSDSGDDT